MWVPPKRRSRTIAQSKCERTLQHHALRLLPLALLAGEAQAQSERAGGPQRQAGAQYRFVARKTNAIDRHPVVETGETDLERIAVLVQRVPPRRATVELHQHAVRETPATFGAQPGARLQTSDRVGIGHQSKTVTAPFRERALVETLITQIHERRDPRVTDPKLMTAFQRPGDVATGKPAAHRRGETTQQQQALHVFVKPPAADLCSGVPRAV